MRIADILTSTVDESDGDDHFSMISTPRAEGRGRKVHCALRRLIHSCRLPLLNLSKKSGKEKEHDRTAAVKISANGLDAGASSPASSVPLSGVSEQHIKEMSFNLGAGFGLFFLAAASKHEFDKMKELRTQMEVILQDVKEELQRKHTISGSSDSNKTPAYSTTRAQEAPNFDIHHSFQNHRRSYTLPDSEITMMSNKSSTCHEPRQEEFAGEMDQLATELETELELLQLRLDQEHFQKHSKQQRAEIAVKDTSSEGSFSVGFGEEADSQEAADGDHHGVRPNELERRLYELLETRQKERINELEAALEYTKHKLHEKEIEATWWKDSARLFSLQYPETSRLSSEHEKDTSQLSR
ncbi:hypothetical protein AAG906_017564 [Vitis piasezkii]